MHREVGTGAILSLAPTRSVGQPPTCVGASLGNHCSDGPANSSFIEWGHLPFMYVKCAIQHGKRQAYFSTSCMLPNKTGEVRGKRTLSSLYFYVLPDRVQSGIISG